MESVSASGGYAQALADQPTSAAAQLEAQASRDNLEQSDAADEDADDDAARQTGDLRVYGYYIRVVGKWTIAWYLFTCACCVFGLTFPCKTSAILFGL